MSLFPSPAFEIYNLLTPDGDGNNDTWYIEGIEDYPDNTAIIFNRWGDKVREFTGYENLKNYWDGTNSKGERLPAGTYYYILNLNSTDSRTGWILLRTNTE